MPTYYGSALGDALTGTTEADSLWGLDGNDWLDGLGGADLLYGGAGNDIYYVGEREDQVFENVGEGTDRVVTTLAWYQIGGNVEELHFAGPAEITFYGTGNALANVLRGGDGDDSLDGAAGADALWGGLGNDMYIVDDVADTANEAADGGIDMVYAWTSYFKLGAHVEGLTYRGEGGFTGIGNDQANHLAGGEGDDVLDGGLGADHLLGEGGNDTYHVDSHGDVVAEEAGKGDDTVVVKGLLSHMLAANVERLTYAGEANFQAHGNGLDNVLTTGVGHDLLSGGAGADTMAGGAGNDSYYVTDAGDKVVEAANGGTDTVWTTLTTYVLAANVEVLDFEGAFNAPFYATGNALDNVIGAGQGADRIDGGAGADRMTGYDGDDTYVVDNVGDVVVETSGGGADEIRTLLGSRSDYAAMYVLPDHVENLAGTAAVGQGVYGNALDNVVRMGAGGDLVVLHDGGDDRVEGGGGNDFLYYGATFTDRDSNDGGAGFDTVGLLGTYTLAFAADDLVDIEKLAVYSSGPNAAVAAYDLTLVDANVAAGKALMVVAQSLSAAETLRLDASAETDGSFNIRGGKGADTIVGGAKADQIWGNVGADLLTGGGGADQFEYLAAAESTRVARDEILDFGLGDRLNLKAIDADGNAANGNGKFAFIGDAAFGHVAGQLRAVGFGNEWLVEGDINGDGLADLSIMVTTTGGHDLVSTDFWL